MSKSKIISLAVFLVNLGLTYATYRLSDGVISEPASSSFNPAGAFLVPSVFGLYVVWSGGTWWYSSRRLDGIQTASDYIPAFIGWLLLIVPIAFNILDLTGVI